MFYARFEYTNPRNIKQMFAFGVTKMGTRGPKPGSTTNKKRILVPRRLVIQSDHELLLAQHMNERLEAFLIQVEDDKYPMNAIEVTVVSQVVSAAEILQHALIEGIETYSVRLSPANHASGADGDMFLPGDFAIGQKRGRARPGERGKATGSGEIAGQVP